MPENEVIKAVKLTAIAGAYWRGDEKREQLTRIYGITFPKKSMLDEYLVLLEEAKKRDHRKIGKEMELFTFSSRVGLGLPLWLPRGSVMRFELEKFLRKKQNEYGYLPVVTPHIGSKDLYVTSGHYAKYGKDSFQPIHTPQEGEEYMLKPMNCPHHCEIFRSSPRSYKDLPLRLAEFGTVYRYEQSGELHGLTRVRSFTQDDAHMFVTPDQLKGEFEKVIDLILYVFRIFKFDKYTAQVSLRDPNNKAKYIGSDENWEKAENAIIEAAKEKGLKTVVEYGEAAFYGPKLDFMVKDAIGRKWEISRILFPRVSFLSSKEVRISELFSKPQTFFAYSAYFSLTGSTLIWSGLSQRGRCPLVCSSSTAVNLSMDPNGARWIMIGRFLLPSASVYSSWNLSGRL